MHELNAAKRKRSSPRFWVVKNGSLYARFQYIDEAGRSRDKYRAISDKRTARSVVEEMRQELKSHGGKTLHSDKMSFGELAEEFSEIKLVEATYSNGVKISGRRSLSSAKSELKPLKQFFGQRVLRSIKPNDLETYKKHRLSQNTKLGTRRKLSTVNREMALLRTIFNFGLQNDWIIQNPFSKAKGIISLSAEVERSRVLSFEEERRLLAACTGRRSHLRGLLICALDTAMRRGEIFKMKWEDVNFKTGEVRIPQTNTKTEEARTVCVTPRLLEELRGLWQTSPRDRNRRIFGIVSSIKHSFITACKEAGVEDFHFHDCRHTATTRMIASGSPHTEVMKITGHSQIKTFLRYLNLTPETTSSVASRLHNYISERQPHPDLISDRIN